MNTVSIKYGWFSQTMCDQSGYHIYLDTNGNEVHITVVEGSDKKESIGTRFGDVRFVGEVTKWVSSHPAVSKYIATKDQ